MALVVERGTVPRDLAARGESALVARTSMMAQMQGAATSNSAQALAIKGSEKKKYLGAAEKTGIGLLVILKKSGKLGTLKTVFVADSNALDIKPGTKIIIERSKN